MFGSKRTMIGRGAHFIGKIKTEGAIGVSGKLEGDLDCVELMVSNHGHVIGSIDASRVTIDGKVDGPVRAKHIVIASRAHVIGDISCQTLAIDKGARVEGTLAFAVDDPTVVKALPKGDKRGNVQAKGLIDAEDSTRIAELVVEARHASGNPNFGTQDALSFLARQGNGEAKKLLKRATKNSGGGTQIGQ